MNELINIKNDEAVTTSLAVADIFGKRHTHVLDKINQIIENDSTEKSAQCFRKSSYTDESGKRNAMYYMNRDGFSFLVMGFTGKAANEWKWKYIEAFNNMEEILTERKTALWQQSRGIGKIQRRSETDVIKEFVEYAKEQGSGSADKYYIHFSKLANKVCGVKERDLATVFQLNNLTLVERAILITIRNGMKLNIPYKDIYKNCKKQVELFSDVAYLEEVI